MRKTDRARASGLCCIVVLFAGIACSEQPGEEVSTGPEIRPAYKLESEVLFANDSLGSPRSLAVVGDLLVVGDGIGSSPLWILHRSDPERRLAFGRRGSGPTEIRSPWSLTADRSGGAVWVYDMSMRRMSHVSLADSPTVARTFLINVPQPVTGPELLSDSTFVSPGLLHAGRVAEFNMNGAPVRTFGQVPPGRAEIPPHVRQHAYQSTLRVKPDRSRVVIATRHADQIEIYAADGRQVAKVKGPRNFEPIYESKRRGQQHEMTSGPDLRFGYISLAVTNEWILALYSGHSRRERPGRANYGDVLHVYDWNGALRKVIALSAPSFAIAVDPDGRTLYATREDPEPAVLRYTLPAQM